MLKVIFLFAFVLVGGNVISAFTPATSQDVVVGDTISPMSLPISPDLPIESYQAV